MACAIPRVEASPNICLGRCVYTCYHKLPPTLQKSELRARPRFARTYAGVLPDSWCPTLSAPPIGPALPPDSSRWSPFIICMYVYVHSFGFFSPRTKVYLFFGKKYSGLPIVKFITKKTICTSCRVQLSWELMRP